MIRITGPNLGFRNMTQVRLEVAYLRSLGKAVLFLQVLADGDGIQRWAVWYAE